MPRFSSGGTGCDSSRAASTATLTKETQQEKQPVSTAIESEREKTLFIQHLLLQKTQNLSLKEYDS